MLLLKKHIVCSFILLFPFLFWSQSNYNPIDWSFSSPIEKAFLEDTNFIHTSFRPVRANQVNWMDISWYNRNLKTYSVFTKKILKDNLIHVQKKDVELLIDPILDFRFGRDLKDSLSKNLTTNLRGFKAELLLGDKITVYTSFRENQSFYPSYVSSFVSTYNVLPGQNRVKKFKEDGFDVGTSEAYFSYSPLSTCNITIGYSKNFIGEGYRSLLLSDNTSSYPFIKTTFSLFKNRVQYTNFYSVFQDLDRLPVDVNTEAMFKRKNGVFNYLSLKVTNDFELGFFEGTMIKRYDDSLGNVENATASYVPIIGVSSLTHGLKNTRNNVLFGFNFKYRVNGNVALYGQIAVDDTENNKYGFQLGFKSYSLFDVDNFNVRLEYNNVFPKTYTSNQNRQNWIHYNQALSHPYGEDFQEILTHLQYFFKGIFFDFKYHFSISNTSSDFDYQGSGVYYNTNDLNGIYKEKNTLNYFNFEISYLINPRNDFRLFAGDVLRETNLWSGKNTNYLYIGLRTLLNNSYTDF